jgi:hypothetical protein
MKEKYTVSSPDYPGIWTIKADCEIDALNQIFGGRPVTATVRNLTTGKTYEVTNERGLFHGR